MIEVVRREQSVVELRRIQDPVQRYIEDAFAVAKSRDVPAEALRVIPGFCRLALEAAASLAATRRLLHQGKTYAEVQRVACEADDAEHVAGAGVAARSRAQRRRRPGSC